MLRRLLRSLRYEIRTHRMARFAVWVLAYGLAVWVVDRFGRGAPGLLWFLFWATALPTAGYYLFRLQDYVRRRLMWRLHRRLVAAYIFFVLVPIVLILVLVRLGITVMGGQFAAFIVANRLRLGTEKLAEMNRAIAHLAQTDPEHSPGKLADHLRSFYLGELRRHAESYPAIEITLQVGPELRAFSLDGKALARPATIPVWLKDEEYSALVADQGRIELRAVDLGWTAAGPLKLVLSQPITPLLLDQVGQGVGPVGTVVGKSTGNAISFETGVSESAGSGRGDLRPGVSGAGHAFVVHSQHLVVPPAANLLDFRVYGTSTLVPVPWTGDRQQNSEDVLLVYVTSRAFALSGQLLSTLGDLSGAYVTLFYILAVILLGIELFSLVVGIRLNRSITSTVDRLYEATERVKRGDFSHRIGMKATDQLSALGAAFDSMTASVERLLQESIEKSRLEGELEFAHEVQRRLFPQVMPEVRGLLLYGICQPARVVSGDYYDCMLTGDDRLALVLGDISGKGISAALLMASIQSALHAQFYESKGNGDLVRAAALAPDEVVRRLNGQLYESTPQEKYATFFYGVYDGHTRRLAYTNAGHPPPALFRRGRIERLNVGGTVVGLFPSVRYEKGAVELEPGDVLLAYTDGMTEPENSFGEEFGEERLFQVARRCLGSPPKQIADELYRAVSDWTGSPELQDDMTLLIATAG